MNHTGNHLRLIESGERVLADAMMATAKRHADDAGVKKALELLAAWSSDHARALAPELKRYPGAPAASVRLLAATLFKGDRTGSIGLLRDLQDLALLGHAVHGNWTVVDQLAAALRDDSLKILCDLCIPQTLRQTMWIDSHIKEIAPQALVVPR